MFRSVNSRMSACLLVIASALTATAQSWSGGPSLNEPRGFMPAVMDPWGNLHVLGGMERTCSGCPNPQTIRSSIETLAFDGESYAAQWTVSPTQLPIERYFHSAVVCDGFMYVIGGARWGASPSHAEPILRVDRYDFLMEQWDSTTVPPLPYGSLRHGTVVDRLNRIWVIGGGVANAPNARADVLVYDPMRPQLGWQSMPPLNTARVFPGAVVDDDGRIWVIGGLSDGYTTHLNTVESIDPLNPTAWTLESATLPAPVSNSIQAALGEDGCIYATGGWANHWYLGAVLRFNPREPQNGWVVWSSLMLPRNEHASVRGADGRIYVIGGEAQSVVSQTNVESISTKFCAADLNNDRAIGLSDLAILLSVFGSVCP
ncbi:MAG: Kelch repeat-containing protein [Planctomycetota bacterium]